jgi:hypothetical protein
MATRGRKRKHNPTIPDHIDQSKLPVGIYWDASGTGRWYVRERRPDGSGWSTPTVAGPRAQLSDLHAIAEGRRGDPVRGTLGRLMKDFHASARFAALSASTRKDYAWCRSVLEGRKLRSGMTWADLQVRRMTPAMIQRLVDLLADGEGTPAKANHVLRYLRRLIAWGMRTDDTITANPAKGVEQAAERKLAKMPTPEAYAAVLAFARAGGQRKAHSRGSLPPYLAPLMEITYLAKLRGIEAVSLTEASIVELDDEPGLGLLARRRKGSRDNVTRLSDRLTAAVAEARAVKAAVLARPGNRNRPTFLRPEDRPLFVSEDGEALPKAALETAWQNLMKRAIAAGVITREQRFTLHGLKHRGITDSADKRSGGHMTEAMRQRYDHELEVFDPPDRSRRTREFSGVISGGKEKGT